MKNLLTTWIIVQLLVIGGTMNLVRNKIIDNTYECNQVMNKENNIISYIIPLMYFLPEQCFIKNYCDKQK